MRPTTVVLLALLAASPAFAKEGELRVRNDVARSELVFTIGPVNLPPPEHGEIDQPKTQAIAVPISGFLHGFTVQLVDSEGHELPSVLLHHVNIIAPERRELFSPIMQRIAAAGQETAPVRLPRVLGYPVAAGERVLLKAMVHNPTAVDYRGVRVRVRLPYTSAAATLAPLHVFPFYLDVMPPAGLHSYDLPPGRSERSWEGRPAVAARILALGGHLHKYAEVLRLEDVTTGNVLWETTPHVDENGNVVGMPQDYVIKRLGIRLDPAHTYRLTAVYENPTGDTITDGGMGAVGGIVLVDRNAPWPGVDADDPQYALDVATQLESQDDGMMNMNHEPVGAGGGAHGAHAAPPADSAATGGHHH